jgi:hypothetical protein
MSNLKQFAPLYDDVVQNTADIASNAASTATSIAEILSELSAISQINLLVNSRFLLQQASSPTQTGQGADGYVSDMWDAGASGVTYTKVTENGAVTFTITAGTIVQAVEDIIMHSTGTVVASWEGTALARINGGEWGSSGITASVNAGEQAELEFGVGTFRLPKLEYGDTPTIYTFTNPSYERYACYRHFIRREYDTLSYIGKVDMQTGTVFRGIITDTPLPFRMMRVSPTITRASGGSYWTIMYTQNYKTISTLEFAALGVSGTLSTAVTSLAPAILCAYDTAHYFADARLSKLYTA